jgi:hypothetical protein
VIEEVNDISPVETIIGNEGMKELVEKKILTCYDLVC